MPNWCAGEVEVFGKPENIENFCRLFVFDDKNNPEFKTGDIRKDILREIEGKGNVYFARSFANMSWKDFKEEYLGDYGCIEIGKDKFCANFGIDFAWSCWSCLVEGYPDRNEECVTLKWACEVCDVEVNIKTEEGGVGFEEKLSFKNGKLDYDCWEMPTYKCNNCGAEQQIPTNSDINIEPCVDCEAEGDFKEIEKT